MLKGLGKDVELHVHQDTDHAFFNDTRPEVYDARDVGRGLRPHGRPVPHDARDRRAVPHGRRRGAWGAATRSLPGHVGSLP